jgi:hypothetical protein
MEQNGSLILERLNNMSLRATLLLLWQSNLQLNQEIASGKERPRNDMSDSDKISL